MRTWLKEQRVGFAVRTMAEFKRALNLGVNLVEIKLDRFAKDGHPLYFYERGVFRPNQKVLGLLAYVARQQDIIVQLHLPIEDGINLEREAGINIGVPEHHQVALDRFIFLEEIFRQHHLGKVITMHPLPFAIKGKELIQEKTALAGMREFFEKLDAIRLRDRHRTLIGLENQPDPKKQAACLGYLPSHFREALKNTRTIGLTVDTGHRRLTKDFTVSGFLQLGLPFVNFHFHGNDGEFNAENYDDDQHQFPNTVNVKGYRNYLRYFRRHRPPIVLEISHMERYEDAELKQFLEKFGREIA
jgi:hypothetical protein